MHPYGDDVSTVTPDQAMKFLLDVHGNDTTKWPAEIPEDIRVLAERYQQKGLKRS